jgi:hypothetical protein
MPLWSVPGPKTGMLLKILKIVHRTRKSRYHRVSYASKASSARKMVGVQHFPLQTNTLKKTSLNHFSKGSTLTSEAAHKKRSHSGNGEARKFTCARHVVGLRSHQDKSLLSGAHRDFLDKGNGSMGNNELQTFRAHTSLTHDLTKSTAPRGHPDAHAGKAIRWLVVAYHNLSIV